MGHIAGILAAGVAMVGTGAAVTASSYSAFSATTDNPTSNWTAGTVHLSDNDSNTALFNTGNLKPTSTDTKCITVTSDGSLASTVKLYSSGVTGALAQYINLQIDAGGGTCGTLTSPSSVYSGTLSALGAANTSFASGLGTSWTPTGTATETKIFRFTYTVDSATPNGAQGAAASAAFTWEAQNN